ncbi:mammalian cell entry protein, partial [Mycobacterium sp. ITM-2017-0098]
VLSVSAVGEQYVDLRPNTDAGPYLEDGARIPVSNTTVPQQVGNPVLGQAVHQRAHLIEHRADLLDETFKAFNGAGPDFGSLLDSASTITNDANGVSEEFRTL